MGCKPYEKLVQPLEDSEVLADRKLLADHGSQVRRKLRHVANGVVNGPRRRRSPAAEHMTEEVAEPTPVGTRPGLRGGAVRMGEGVPTAGEERERRVGDDDEGECSIRVEDDTGAFILSRG